ncbi:MAG: sigma-70 family RNA polymerase sigma factor [Pirellulales bacterium]
MSELESEHELIARAIRLDQAALERLLFHHYAPLARHVGSFLPAALQGVVSVEDVLQETFIHVFRDIGRFEPRAEGSFAGWLRNIADHRLHDMLRACTRKKRGGDRHRVLGLPHDAQGSVFDLDKWLSASGSTPSRHMARGEVVQAVQVAVAGLAEDYREVIRWRYLEGKSVEETAAIMGRSPGAVRGLADRAKEKIREALGRSSGYLGSR